jgi:hypothetical protein
MRRAINNFWVRLKNKVFRSCVERIGYRSNGIYYFSPGSDELSIEAGQVGRAKFVIILGRECYFETVREYPIGRLSDLKKILACEESPGPHGGLRFDQIIRSSESSFSVTSWVVKHSIVSALENRPWVLVPETACLTANGHDTEVMVNRLGKSLAIRNGPDGIKSALTEGDSASASRLGLYTQPLSSANQGDTRHISEQQFPSALVLGLKHILITSPWLFLLPPDRSAIRRYPWVRAAKLSSYIFAGYIALSSAYLFGFQLVTDYRIDKAREASQVAIELQKENANLKSNITELNQLMEDTEPTWVIWDLALGLAQDGVRFTAINSINSRVKFHGSATKASTVLSKLADDPRIVSADYASAVRNHRGKEIFVIEFELNPDYRERKSKSKVVAAATQNTSLVDKYE